MTQPNPSTDPPSTGFILVERVLHEYRDRGRSLTVDGLKGKMERGLSGIAGDASPRTAKEAQAVRQAFLLATELIETMRAEARQPRQTPK